MTKDRLLVFCDSDKNHKTLVASAVFLPLPAKPLLTINSGKILNPHFLSPSSKTQASMETPTMKPDTVLILDFGSQYTHLITRRIRSLNVFSLVINGTSSLKSITSYNPRVVILSGGPHSVHALDAPSFPDGFIEWAESNGVHVLGICYGLQLIVQKLGGVVVEGENKEYGKMEIEVKGKSEIFGSESVGDKQMVWMSHGDEAVKLPEGFEVVAQSAQGAVAALENRKKRIYGFQYHPEVLKLEESDTIS